MIMRNPGVAVKIPLQLKLQELVLGEEEYFASAV